MRFTRSPGLVFTAMSYVKDVSSQVTSNGSVDMSWHAPPVTNVNDLNTVINSTGTFGFVFNSSVLPPGVKYGAYDWCNMPHVRATEYPRVNGSFQLQYVEVIHRHHKRTPYAANTFPVENYAWYCNDEGLFYYGAPLPTQGANRSSNTYWDVYTSQSNPLVPQGFNGTCQFPQITRGGLDDSWQHGKDLFGVYHDLLNFLPSTYDPSLISYRVTNNVITSQVASMLIAGMYPSRTSTNTPLVIQPDSIDSLEPAYTCSSASALYSSFASGSTAPGWTAHLTASSHLSSTLDAISGIAPDDEAWHVSYDHYFDNLSSRLCHAKPLPCNVNDTTKCVTQEMADEVFRLGEYEYAYTYRSAGPETLQAAVGSYGIWIAELAQNLRFAAGLAGDSSVPGNATETESGSGSGRGSADGKDGVKYRHNVAHDGSVSRLLAILQVDDMVWPGMGAEVVFELYKAVGSNGTSTGDGPGKADLGEERVAEGEYFLRVLWGGQVLRSSSPTLGVMEMVPLQTVLAYFDGLVGVGASLIPGICNAS